MREIEIRKPVSDDELRAMAAVRVASAVVAYAAKDGPSEDQVFQHYSEESDEIINYIKSGEHESAIAIINNTLVGMCVWSVDGSIGKAMIRYLYVHPNYQNEGYGSALLDKAMAAIGNVSIELTTQNAHAFYEAQGFKGTGKYVIDEITTEEILLRPHQ